MRFFPSRISARLAAASIVLLFLTGVAFAAPTDDGNDVIALSSDLRVRVLRGRDIELEVRAAAGEGYEAIARRVTTGGTQTEALEIWNAGRELSGGDWVRVPLALLDSDHRRLVLDHLFPGDRSDNGDRIHIARRGRLPVYDCGLWQVAEWFTGRGDRFVELMEHNRLSSPELREGQEIRIPAELLLAAFRSGPLSAGGLLEYGSDDEGPYAGYRLRTGEALYSAVVVRFTGRTKAADVEEVAREIAERSGVRDLRDIPVGFKVKIPLPLLEPEHLPAEHPRRLEAEAARAELAAELARRPAERPRRELDGVAVILDPGHGGRDLGTMNNGVWEHDYVYDVTCRLKQRLESETKARVFVTLEDRETGCVPSKTDKLEANRQGTILTDPPFLAREPGEARVGVNLRWYLANSILRRLERDGTEPERVVFVSLHADARHPSLSGVMVYVAGAKYSGQNHGFSSKTYKRYAEVREKPFVRFPQKDRVRSEALSTRFAGSVVAAFERLDLPIQPYQPVRNRIIRGRSIFVPAVLRANAVPNKILVEMVNLSNRRDAALLASARDRQRMADAVYDALLAHFGAGD